MRLTEPARSLAAALGSALFLLAPGWARAGGEPFAPAREAAHPGSAEAIAAAPLAPTTGEVGGVADDLGEDELRRRIAEAARTAAGRERSQRLRLASPLVDDAARKALLEAHRPPALEVDPNAAVPVPATVQAALWARWARVLETLPDDEAARDAYARAIGLGRDEAELWLGLGRTRLRCGDRDGAEAAFLAAFERAPRDAAVYRALGALYLRFGQPDVASVALERAAELAPGEPEIQALLARARAASQSSASGFAERAPAGSDAERGDRRAQLEAALHRAALALPAPVRQRLDAVAGALSAPRGRKLALAAACALALLLALLRAPRGRGDLAVSIEYPEELRGTFSVRVGMRSFARKRGRSDRQLVLRGGTSTPTEHHLVSRETQFRGLRPGSWFVSVEGIIQDPDSEELLGEVLEEQEISLRNGDTARVPFDVAPRGCPIDVKVLWDKRPAREAAVAVKGLPQSLRFARGGSLRMGLAKGSHTVLVGCGDRVAEVALEVDSFKPTAVEIDMAATRDVIFKGCPPAVEPYLHGDLGAAARALEREGQAATAHRLLARLHREQGHRDRAAEHFEKAGQLVEAAELRAELCQFPRSGDLYERAGDAPRAAEMFRRAGDLTRAGGAFERAGDLESAISCYRQAGDVPSWISALERAGAYFDASRVAFEKGERARGIRLLQQLGPADPQFPEACSLLADAFEREGHRDLAAGKLEEYLSTGPTGGGAPDLRSRLAALHEETGNVERALEVLEALRRDEPTYPNIATRVEELRKKVSERLLADSAAQRTTAPSAARTAPTAWLDENRYELIEEIGRGGMGVVFKARDTRLERVVALKRLPENLRDHPKAIQLFLREAQASARLTHPNIVTVYDADQADGTFFITMELLKGRPLHQILRKKQRFTARDVGFLGRQIAAGLGYAHEHGVVHRDIKTANLFFTTDRTVKIMDFGLAKMMQEVRKAATVIGGTPFYMAPEQAAGESVDQRADIYAFGVTLFELATGRVPFPDGDVAYHHRHTPPPDPRSVAADVPALLAELILHMLRKQPEERCESAAEVALRLEPLTRADQAQTQG